MEKGLLCWSSSSGNKSYCHNILFPFNVFSTGFTVQDMYTWPSEQSLNWSWNTSTLGHGRPSRKATISHSNNSVKLKCAEITSELQCLLTQQIGGRSVSLLLEPLLTLSHSEEDWRLFLWDVRSLWSPEGGPLLGGCIHSSVTTAADVLLSWG